MMETGRVVAVTEDAVIRSRIEAAARGRNVVVDVVLSQEELEKVAPGARLVLLDLARQGVDVPAVVETAHHGAGIPVVAFAAMLSAEQIQDAREAGCDAVMTSPELELRLPGLLGY